MSKEKTFRQTILHWWRQFNDIQMEKDTITKTYLVKGKEKAKEKATKIAKSRGYSFKAPPKDDDTRSFKEWISDLFSNFWFVAMPIGILSVAMIVFLFVG